VFALAPFLDSGVIVIVTLTELSFPPPSLATAVIAKVPVPVFVLLTIISA